jgi:hypothetical protein
MKYGRFFVFIRHDSAETLGFRYGLTPDIGALKFMASTGGFVPGGFAVGAEPVRRPGEAHREGVFSKNGEGGGGGRNARGQCSYAVGLAV